MRLITVKKFSEVVNVRLARGYELARRLPPGVKVGLGRQVRINEEALAKWIESGGTLSDGNGARDEERVAA
jgi:hypothetical protein